MHIKGFLFCVAAAIFFFICSQQSIYITCDNVNRTMSYKSKNSIVNVTYAENTLNYPDSIDKMTCRVISKRKFHPAQMEYWWLFKEKPKYNLVIGHSSILYEISLGLFFTPLTCAKAEKDIENYVHSAQQDPVTYKYNQRSTDFIMVIFFIIGALYFLFGKQDNKRN